MDSELLETIDPDSGATAIVCPVTSELIDPRNFDQLAEALVRIKKLQDRLYDGSRLIREYVARMAIGPNRTRYVRGTKLQAEVVAPDLSWSNATLKKIYEESDNPAVREVLRIDGVAVNARTWKTWQNTTGNAEFEALKKQIESACLGVTQSPSVKITEIA